MESVQLQYDGSFMIAMGNSRKETNWKKRTMRWSELRKKLQTPIQTSETVTEYWEASKPQRDEIKDVGGFVGGVLQGRRKAENVKWRQLVTLDADFAKEIIDVQALPHACMLYTTHSHRPEKPRFRILIPLMRPVNLDEYPAVARRLAADINIEIFDDTTYEVERLMYWPSVSADGEYVFLEQDAPWVDPDEVLARYTDWGDISQWPRSSRSDEIRKKQGKKQGNPMEKQGVVGAFCRTYRISDAIDQFLGDKYAPCGDDRYTYVGGSTTGGLVIYDDDTFAFSFHSTDPVGGKLVNAFDLVRIHQFGDQDENVKPDTPVHRLPSYKAMLLLAEEDEAVQKQIEEDRLNTAEDDFTEGRVHPKRVFFIDNRFIPRQLGQWFMRDKHGFVLNEGLYLYQNGVYRLAEREFFETTTAILRDEFRTSRLNESLAWIKNTVQEVSPMEVVDTGDWLNVKNGLLNLKTGEFRSHTPDWMTTIQLPVEYDPDADCPAIKRFFSRVLPEDCIPLIEEMIGYCLIPSMQYEKAFFLHGEGENGKGTTIAVITAMLGDENVSSVSLQELAENRFAIARLFGKMMNAHADIPPKYIENSGPFKELVSGDLIFAEEKFKPGFQFRNRAKLIFSMNEIPATNDTTYGFFRRQAIIPFPNRFNNRQLRAQLFRELPGLLNVAIKGLRRLEEQGGFSEPESVQAAQEDYRGRIDSAYRFLTECCQPAKGEMVGKQDLYSAYKLACVQDWGLKPISQAKFNKRVQTVYPGVTEYRSSTRMWKGLSHTSSEFDDDFLS